MNKEKTIASATASRHPGAGRDLVTRSLGGLPQTPACAGVTRNRRRARASTLGFFRLGFRRLGFGGGGFGLGLVEMSGVAALGDAGRLAGAAAQIIELGAADGAAAHDLDLVDVGRIKREDALDALAEADLADGEASCRGRDWRGRCRRLRNSGCGCARPRRPCTPTRSVSPGRNSGMVLDWLNCSMASASSCWMRFMSLRLRSSRRAPEGGGLRASP